MFLAILVLGTLVEQILVDLGAHLLLLQARPISCLLCAGRLGLARQGSRGRVLRGLCQGIGRASRLETLLWVRREAVALPICLLLGLLL